MKLDELEKNIDELSLDELLDAFERAFTFARDFHEINYWKQRRRQATAFRARILKMDAEKEDKLSWCKRELDLERRINLEAQNDSNNS